MLNHIVIMGRFVRDPELRRTQSGTSVASFTLAVDRDRKDENGSRECDFISCVAWKGIGEFVFKYFAKGSMAVVSGRLQIREWKDKDGNKRSSAEIVAENVYFGDSKRDTAGSNPSAGTGNSQGSYAAPAAAPTSDFAELEDEDTQLPF